VRLLSTTLGTNYSSSFIIYLKIALLAFLSPILVSAEGINKQPEKNFCNTPLSNEINQNLKNINISGNIENGMEAILDRRVLRVLVEKKSSRCVVSKIEKQLLEEFADEYNLKLAWVFSDSKDLVIDLVRGKGDVIVGQSRNISTDHNDHLQYTHTWANSEFKIVQRNDTSRIRRVSDLAGRHVAAYKASPVWEYLTELSKNEIGMTLQEIPDYISHKKTMERVKSGQYDLIAFDSIFLDEQRTLNYELQASLSLTNNRSMAWAVSRNSKDLHKILNQYLDKQHLLHGSTSIHYDDLPSIKQRGVIRIITDANPSHYYQSNGKLIGFEYELLREYAKENQLRVDVVVANSRKEMFELLFKGRGDIVAASLPSISLSHNSLIKYTKPYDYASPVIIGRSKDQQIIDTRDLVGKRISLSRDNPYWEHMTRLKNQGYDFELIEEDSDIATVLLKVAFGVYDLTVMGGHQIRSNRIEAMGLKTEFILSEPLAHRWAVRAKNNKLHNDLNMFIKNEYRGVKYNVLHAKYFDQPYLKESYNDKINRANLLSPYQDETKFYAEKYGFDWRLITALMFQESRFNPNANSYAGAKGVMQLTKTTAKLMGLRDTRNVEKSIDAGVRYLSQLRNRFDKTILINDRMWFAVASYNSGYTRLKRAQALAEEMGLDKNKWFQNVELAMLLMAKPYKKNGKKIRDCRCGQTVVYVREIRTRYFNYIRLTETQQLAMRPISRKTKQFIN